MSAPNPYNVPVHDVMHRPGELRERVLEFDAPEQLGEAVAVVKQGAPVRIDLRLEGLHDGVLVTADVDTVATGECVRCLDPVEIPVEVEFQELFAYSEDEAFDFAIRDDHVNLESVVRDAVVLALPFQPVCRPDCPGLDPATGEKLQDGAVPGDREATDPRWAALEGFQPTENE
ncbi:YceD family protein [Protaetiibacter intestinalis]|nr:YceD family protein [Protaetiibacter intestinalis]